MSNQVTSQANLLAYIDSMKEEHDQYISELAKHSNEVSAAASFIGNIVVGDNLWKA